MIPAPAARRANRSWLARQDWYLALALSIFVGVTVWFGRAIADFFAPAEHAIATPALVGQTVTDAIATAQRDHIRATVVERTPSDRYPRDVVLRQDPPAGAEVREGRSISLVVSTGVQIFPMPDLRAETLREVGLDLSYRRLQFGKTKTVASDEPAGTVVAQDPPPLSSVRSGSVVNVELSRGGPRSIRVPNFLGLSIDGARELAADSHVHLGQVVWTPFGRYGPARGVIVRQRPAAAEAIDPTDLVSLQVSAGPAVTGYLVRQVHAVVVVPADAVGRDDRAPRVRVEIHDGTGDWNVYNAFAEARQRLDFNLTVVGAAKLDVFVNDEPINSTDLGNDPPLEKKSGPR